MSLFSKKGSTAFFVILLTGCAFYIRAEGNGNSINHSLDNLQHQERERYLSFESEKKKVRGEALAKVQTELDLPQEHPCFTIEKINISKVDALPYRLRYPLRNLIRQAEGRCLGGNSAQVIAAKLQNILISRGYVTTRISIPRQNISRGVLNYEIIPGSVARYSLTSLSDKYITLWSAFPSRKNNILSLRDIEQGLENLQQVPGVDVNIKLSAGSEPGETEVLIERKQSQFWRVGGWFDDAGSKSTGRYQSGVALYLDNPTSLSDTFYFSAGKNLNRSKKYGTQNYALYYSLPFGYNQLTFFAANNESSQMLSVPFARYRYRGKDRNALLRLNRILYRDAMQKTTLTLGLKKRRVNYYLGNTEIEVQQRNMTKVFAGLSWLRYVNSLTLNSSLTYQRNVNILGAKSGPEALADAISRQSRVVNLDVTADYPFTFHNQPMSYVFSFHQQYSVDSLAVQDKLSLGNRWTVRGFDGEMTMLANKGAWLRNELNWNFPQRKQQFYAGIDYARVTDNSNGFSSNHLAGVVAGLRGNAGPIGYHVFAGKPLLKPDELATDSLTTGFSLQWQF